MEKKRIIVASTGASGQPILKKCLEILKEAPEFEAHLIISDSAALTFRQEMGVSADVLTPLAGRIYPFQEIGSGPASGSFKTAGMLIVPCSMKTVAGICSGYADNLILRAADVTLKEQRPLVLAARETPLSPVHLRNLSELSRYPGVHIVPPMLTFYHNPKSIEDMVYHIAARLLEPFGIEARSYRRWEGL